MGSEFGGGYSLLPPIIEGKADKMTTKCVTLPAIYTGNSKDNYSNSTDKLSNSTDKYNIINYINAHSDELDVIHRRRNKNYKPWRHEKVNKTVVNGEIDASNKDLPTMPFHSILGKPIPGIGILEEG